VLRQFLSAGLDGGEKEFLAQNIEKHRRVIWITIVMGIFALYGVASADEVSTLVLALIAPVTVMGAAWFAVSFGAIPKKLISEAMAVTFWMFLGFMTSLMAMFIAVGYISPAPLWPVLALIFISTMISCIKYDTADGLKAGLDEAMLTHSRYAIEYYRKSGVKAKINK